MTGDAGESYECLYARHRLLEAGLVPVIAAPSKRRLNLVIHDFEPGWDTYIERQGYGAEADLTLDDVRVDDYAAVLVLGGRAPEYLRHDARVLAIVNAFDHAGEVDLRHLPRRADPRRGRAGRRQTGDGVRKLPLGDRSSRRDLRHGPASRARRQNRHGPDLAVAPGVLPSRLRVPDELRPRQTGDQEINQKKTGDQEFKRSRNSL